MQEERGWESSEEEEDVTAIGLLQRTRSADSVSASDESTLLPEKQSPP